MIEPNTTIENQMKWHLVIDKQNKTHNIEEYHRRWMHTTGGILSEDEINLIARVKGEPRVEWIPNINTDSHE